MVLEKKFKNLNYLLYLTEDCEEGQASLCLNK